MMSVRVETEKGPVEYFRNLPELHRALKTRAPTYNGTAFLSEGYEEYCRIDPEFYGFDSIESLRRQVVGGSTDTRMVKNVHKFARNLKANVGVERTRKPSVITGQFRMDRYISKQADCFDRSTRCRIPNKVIKIVVNMSANGGTPFEDIERAAKVVARNVVMLEQSGYRVRVTVCKCNKFYDTDDKLHTVAVDIKDEGQAINYRKLCLGLSGLMYRGVFFSWFACEPDCPYGLGCAQSDEDIVGPQLQKVINPNGVWYTHLYDLMDMVHENHEDLYKAADALYTQIVEMMG